MPCGKSQQSKEGAGAKPAQLSFLRWHYPDQVYGSQDYLPLSLSIEAPQFSVMILRQKGANVKRNSKMQENTEESAKQKIVFKIFKNEKEMKILRLLYRLFEIGKKMRNNSFEKWGFYEKRIDGSREKFYNRARYMKAAAPDLVRILWCSACPETGPERSLEGSDGPGRIKSRVCCAGYIKNPALRD